MQDEIEDMGHHVLRYHLWNDNEVRKGISYVYHILTPVFSICSFTSLITVSIG